ncbi:unnamed protein product [Gadus morhua 'NCC']
MRACGVGTVGFDSTSGSSVSSLQSCSCHMCSMCRRRRGIADREKNMDAVLSAVLILTTHRRDVGCEQIHVHCLTHVTAVVPTPSVRHPTPHTAASDNSTGSVLGGSRVFKQAERRVTASVRIDFHQSEEPMSPAVPEDPLYLL